MARKKVTITLNEETHLKLKRIALDNKKKVSEVYEDVLKEGLRIIENQSNLEDYEVKVE